MCGEFSTTRKGLLSLNPTKPYKPYIAFVCRLQTLPEAAWDLSLWQAAPLGEIRLRKRAAGFAVGRPI